MKRQLIITALSMFAATTALAQSDSEEVQVQMNLGGLDVTTTVKTKTEKSSSKTDEPAARKVAAMSNGDFQRLLQDIKSASFEDDKTNVVKLAAKHNHFNCAQVGALVDAITFEDGKVKVVKLTAKKIVDPEKSHSILSHFTFSDGREKAEAILSEAE